MMLQVFFTMEGSFEGIICEKEINKTSNTEYQLEEEKEINQTE